MGFKNDSRTDVQTIRYSEVLFNKRKTKAWVNANNEKSEASDIR